MTRSSTHEGPPLPRRPDFARRLGPAPAFCLLTCLLTFTVPAQSPEHPLQPPDRSSPRVALRGFLEAGDAVGAFLAGSYLPSPSRANHPTLLSQVEACTEALDLREMPPAARLKRGRAAALSLYEALNRVPLPPWEAIPDADQWRETAGTNAHYWVIPNTEIALRQVGSGPRRGAFLFSPETVANAGGYYQRVQDLPYTRLVPLEDLRERFLSGFGGWMIPFRWIQALPKMLRHPLAGQPGWKWIGLTFALGVVALVLRAVHRLSHWGGAGQPFRRAVARAVLPAFLLLATPALAYFALVQLSFFGDVGSAIERVTTAVGFLAGAWICWRLAPVVAEGIIASPRIASESIDAHLIRICARLLGMVAAVLLLVAGAERIGMPLYGIVTGLGVGGLAIALAAQPTIENLIGGFSLFADKPIRVGDFCRYGAETGTVEAIGMRSTRIRGLDRTLTTIPNAVLSRMSVAIQEDILLRTMDVVAASGTGFAAPSQTLYFARDAGLDPDKSAAALAQVQAWRADPKLPFPEFDPEFRKLHRDTLDYPPNGSPEAARK
ncbi:MAG: mechanosensitive ion channel [Verrucomicrobiae bacterium]|nr:mechanosensitive ion channel [Verrucomicrobiae bacterium]